MSSTVRAALTETRNAYSPMPASVAAIDELAPRLDELRTANVVHHLELIESAAAAGARLVGLGELFPAPYFALHENPMWRALSEDALDGPTVRKLRAAARAHAVVLVAPLYELVADTGRRFNTAVVIDADGEVLGRYRKTHVPEGANEHAALHERYYYDSSDGELGNGPADVSDNPFFPVFETAVGRVGVATCYDRHFEGVVRSLAETGAEIVLSPAVTFGAQSRRMWDLEFQVDAARHRVYIGGSNRKGAEPPFDVEYFGASYFCGPDGVLPRLESRPELVIADLDLDALEARDGSGWDLARDARPETYSP